MCLEIENGIFLSPPIGLLFLLLRNRSFLLTKGYQLSELQETAARDSFLP